MKILALDIGNVCVKIDFNNFARNLHIPEIPPELIALQREMECGRINDEEFFSTAEKLLHRSKNECIDAFNKILISPVDGIGEVVSALKQYGFEARFFSDISVTHLQRTGELFPEAALVPDGIFSFSAGAQKPDEAMFAAFERSFGIPALYTDDRMELIEAARKRGWNAVQFTSAENLQQLIADL